jgi:multidrug efflux system membrane fusion protein
VKRSTVVIALVATAAAAAAGAGVWVAKPGWITMATGFAADQRARGKPPPVANTQRQAGIAVPVEAAAAERKPMPMVIDAVGTVQPIASIPIKARLDSQVVKVHVEEGARVREGDLLFSLDDRTLRAQQDQLSAQLDKDRVQLEQARRDMARAEDLVAKGAGTPVVRDTAATAVKALEAQTAFDQAALANLQAQLTFTEIRAPVSGRIGSITAKAGTVVRMADTQSLAIVNQMDPIYIAFGVPQSLLGELRQVTTRGSVKVEVRSNHIVSDGEIAFLENTIDIGTGTVTAKARMSNAIEGLWPGSFVPVRILLGIEPQAVTIPATAVQIGQNGPYVFVVRDGRATFVAIKVARTIANEAVIAAGLEGGEQVVTSGQLRLADGVAVAVVRPAPAARTPPDGKQGQPAGEPAAPPASRAPPRG